MFPSTPLSTYIVAGARGSAAKDRRAPPLAGKPVPVFGGFGGPLAEFQVVPSSVLFMIPSPPALIQRVAGLAGSKNISRVDLPLRVVPPEALQFAPPSVLR